jgi:hypothetical protein
VRAGIEVVDQVLLPSYTAVPLLLQIFSLVRISVCSNGKSSCSKLFNVTRIESLLCSLSSSSGAL